MVLVYATTAQVEDWIGSTPEAANLAALIRQASILVTAACRNDLYDTASSGIPSDDDLAEAMQEATCAQVEMWSAAGYDVIAGPGGQPARKTTVAVDGASYSTDAYLTATARDSAMTTLCQASYEILRTAGLASAAV